MVNNSIFDGEDTEITNTLTLTPGTYTLIFKDNLPLLTSPFWEQLGSPESPNDPNCTGYMSVSSQGVCYPAYDYLRVIVQGSGVSVGSGVVEHQLHNGGVLERTFKVFATC